MSKNPNILWDRCVGNALRGSLRALWLDDLLILDLKTAPGDGDPGLVTGRDSEGVPGTDIYAMSQSEIARMRLRTYYVDQLVI